MPGAFAQFNIFRIKYVVEEIAIYSVSMSIVYVYQQAQRRRKSILTVIPLIVSKFVELQTADIFDTPQAKHAAPIISLTSYNHGLFANEIWVDLYDRIGLSFTRDGEGARFPDISLGSIAYECSLLNATPTGIIFNRTSQDFVIKQALRR